MFLFKSKAKMFDLMGTNYYFSLFPCEKNVYFSKTFSLWMSPESCCQWIGSPGCPKSSWNFAVMFIILFRSPGVIEKLVSVTVTFYFKCIERYISLTRKRSEKLDVLFVRLSGTEFFTLVQCLWNQQDLYQGFTIVTEQPFFLFWYFIYYSMHNCKTVACCSVKHVGYGGGMSHINLYQVEVTPHNYFNLSELSHIMAL